MKTTVELADDLLLTAKQAAREQGTTLRELIEAGLRKEIQSRKSSDRFVLRSAAFGEGGLRPDFLANDRPDWGKIQEASYERRGV